MNSRSQTGQNRTDGFSYERLLIDLQPPAVKGMTAYRLCLAMRGATNGAPNGSTLEPAHLMVLDAFPQRSVRTMKMLKTD